MLSHTVRPLLSRSRMAQPQAVPCKSYVQHSYLACYSPSAPSFLLVCAFAPAAPFRPRRAISVGCNHEANTGAPLPWRCAVTCHPLAQACPLKGRAMRRRALAAIVDGARPQRPPELQQQQQRQRPTQQQRAYRQKECRRLDARYLMLCYLQTDA